MSPNGKPSLLLSEEALRTTDQDMFANLLETFDYAFHKGNIVKGTLIEIEPHGALIDIGAKTAAYLPAKEIANVPTPVAEAVKPGITYDFYILREENEDGQLMLSMKRVDTVKNWQKLEVMMMDETVLDCSVTAMVKGGLLVDVMGLRGFVPSSHLRVRQPLEALIGTTLSLKILNLDQPRNNIILSHRKVMAEQMAEQRKDLFQHLEVGTVKEGEVVRLTDFGAFVDLGGVDGLLPLSQMSWRWVEHPSDVLKVGDKVKVEVIGMDHDKQRVSLSIKSLTTDPWNDVADVLTLGQEAEGLITRIKHFGAFVEVYPGVEALLPSKDIADFEATNGVQLNVGQTVTATIYKLSPEERRISLGFTPQDIPARVD
jgi:small subunit ribosomal protein S1